MVAPRHGVAQCRDRSELWRELMGNVGIAAVAGRVLGGDLEWPAPRVWRAFRESDTVQVIGIGEAVILLCGPAQTALPRGTFEPHQRLDRSVDYLEANLMAAHQLADVAGIAGVHPMHLARLFRRRFGCSMESSCEGGALRGRGHVASSAAGSTPSRRSHTWPDFADHAHFTRTFVRIAGMTPRRCRAEVRGF